MQKPKVLLTFSDLMDGPDLNLGYLMLDFLRSEFVDLCEIAFIAIVSFEKRAL